MTFEGAVIHEQGVRFAVIIVKPYVVQNRFEASRAIAAFAPHFGVPVVLMAQDSRGTPTYYGRRDIVNFLSKTPLVAVPWRRFTLS